MTKEETSIWWWYDKENKTIVVYTNRKTKLKYKGKPMAEYFNDALAVKPFAKQYKVTMGTVEQKQLFQELGISEESEVKAPRKKRVSRQK